MTEKAPKAPPEKIAGHEFDLNGSCQRESCSLPRTSRMSDILGAQKENLNQLGWAHTGALNQQELDEITKKRDAIWLAIQTVSG